MTRGLNTLVLANDSDIWIAEIDPEKNLPQKITVTGAALAVDAVTVDLSVASGDAPLKVYDRQFLRYIKTGTEDTTENDYLDPDVTYGYVRLKKDLSVTATAGAAALQKIKTAISATSFFTYRLHPIYSANSANNTVSGNPATGSNFRSGGWEESVIVDRNWQIPVSGFLDRDDPALDLLEKVGDETGARGRIWVQITDPSLRSFAGVANVQNLVVTRSQKQFIQFSCQFNGTGKAYREKLLNV